MKGLITLISLIFAFSAWSFEVEFPVKNYKYISDWDYTEEVQNSDKYVVMIFSSQSCLEHTNIDYNCFYFEKKLDYFIPKFSKNVKVVGFNVFMENYQVVSNLQVKYSPSVIIMKNNQIIKRIDPTYQLPDLNNGRLSWQDELLKATLAVVSQIH